MKRFEELDRQPTPMGDIHVRRRFHPVLEVDVWEVILGDEHLMSSLFSVAEEALGHLPLAGLGRDELDVVVGGLGLGYTARAVLEDERVRSLRVVEALPQVIAWHEHRMFPFAVDLLDDPRCSFVHGDFFSMIRDGESFGAGGPNDVDAILVDIDHTPQHVLHPSHADFYEPAGLQRVASRLRSGGVFALWSDDRPDDAFLGRLATVFDRAVGHWVTFPNPHTGDVSGNTVYVASDGGSVSAQ